MQEQAESSIADELLHALENMTLTQVGSLASILGLLATVYILFGVRNIESYYVFTARVPDLEKRMRQHAKKLADFLNDPGSYENQIREELAAAEITVESLRRKLKGQAKKPLKTLLANILERSRGRSKEPTLREVYLQMIKVNEHVRDLREDLKWERH